MAGRNLKAVRRLSMDGLSDKENAPQVVGRLKSLLRRKPKKLEGTAATEKVKKRTAVKHENLVSLEDGTTLKLCASCTNKKKKLKPDTEKVEKKPKLTKKEKDAADENKNNRSLKTSHNKTVEFNTTVSDPKEKSASKKKETKSTTTKPKEVKKTKPAPVKKETLDTSKIPEKPKRVMKKSVNTESEKPMNTRSASRTRNTSIKKETKPVKKATTTKNKTSEKVSKPKKTDKNNSKSDIQPEIHDLNVTELVQSDTKSKKSTKNNNTSKTEPEKIKPEKPKRTIKNKTNVDDKSLKKKTTAKTKNPKIKKTKKTAEANSDNNNQSDTNSETDSTTQNKINKPKNLKRRLSLVAKRVKNISRGKKSAETPLKKTKAVNTVPSKIKKSKSDIGNQTDNSHKNFSNKLLTPDSYRNSEGADINEDNGINNNTITLKNNLTMEPIDNFPIKLEPKDDEYVDINEYDTHVLPNKNSVSLQNNSVISTPESKRRLTTDMMNVTYRNLPMTKNSKNSDQLKDKKNKKEKEARKKFKNDTKVALALSEMSKHFANFQIGKIGKLRMSTRLTRKLEQMSSTEESSSSESCDCDCCSSTSNSTPPCKCWKCQMKVSSCSSSWSGTSGDSEDSDSSVFIDSKKKSRKPKIIQGY